MNVFNKEAFLALIAFGTIILGFMLYSVNNFTREELYTKDEKSTKTIKHDELPELSYNAEKKQQPHILLIITDDQGYNTVGYNGFTKIKTPVIDKLAKSGVILDNYYVQPVCTPTRGQLFSGRHQIHTGLGKVIMPGVRTALPLDTPTIADRLKEAGYSTNLVGKWHLGYYTQRHLPTRRGFDRFFGLLNGHSDHFKHITSGGYDLYDGETPAIMKNYEGIYSTTLFADQAKRIIKNHDSTMPLFLVVSFTAPHGPHQVPEKYSKPYGDVYGRGTPSQIYAGMISCIDEAVGNITDAFKKKGLWNDTLMIYTSDNGAKDTIPLANYPLRGCKSKLFEGGVKVPGFVHSELLHDSVKGTISKELLHVTDWFPTLVGLGQGNLDNANQRYGYDARKTILYGERSRRNEILHDIDLRIISQGDPLFNDTFDTRIRAALRVGDWKVLTGKPGAIPASNKTGNQNNLWLYNIKHDPSENNDLSLTRPEIVKSMLDRLEFHRKTMVPPLKYKFDKRSLPEYHNGFWAPWM